MPGDWAPKMNVETGRRDGGRPPLGLWALAGAVPIAVGTWVWMAFDYSPDVSSGLGYVSCFGLAMVVPVFVISALVLRVLAGGVRRPATVLVAGLALGGALAGYGWWNGRMDNWFRRFGIDPPPVATGPVRAFHASSLSDGGAYLFAMALVPAEFDGMVGRLGLVRVASGGPATVPGDYSQGVLEEDPFTADLPVRRSFAYRGYGRPAGAEVWRRDRYTVVADLTRRDVWIYVDRWSEPGK